MESESPPTPAAAASVAPIAPAAAGSDRFFERTLRVAGWSVALGIALELAQLVLLVFGDRTPTIARVVAETLGKVTWSTFVCVSISCGFAAGRARPQAMALLGLLSAPAGFAIARSVHKSVGSALSVPPGAQEAISPFLLAAIKAVEYGVFGFVVARLSSASTISLRRHLLAGLALGGATAALVCGLVLRAKPDTDATATAVRAASEVLFPIGCAGLVYVSERASRLARRAA